MYRCCAVAWTELPNVATPSAAMTIPSRHLIPMIRVTRAAMSMAGVDNPDGRGSR